jgi:ribosomal protein L11 methylase PrmA
MSMISGSFRDPFGTVFCRDGKIYRAIFEAGVKDFEAAKNQLIHPKLIEAGLLLPHEQEDKYDLFPEGTVVGLTHPRLPMISYPWEWSFSMLKDAAFIHLEAMELLLPQGFWLRDASAFNVQYDGTRLRLIDTLSIGQRTPESPWVAYGQFCSHFLAPLAMAAYCDIRTLSLWRNYIDGYPLDLARKMLPWGRRYRPGLFMHLTLHSRFQDKADLKEDIGKAKPAKKSRVSDRGLIGLVQSLRRTIEKIEWKGSSKVWKEYEEIRNYQSDDISKKTEYVARLVQRLQPKMVWDLGANTGEFSYTAASEGAFVVSIDSDPACTEFLLKKLSGEGNKEHILPLTMDLANPSPGLGWDSCERLSLSDRGPADLVLALALIHHLVLSNCIPLRMIAEWFGNLADYLLVEFVPPNDPMVQYLVRNRKGEHLPYSWDMFQSSFGKVFHFVDQTTLKNGRTLILCKRSKDESM